MFPWASIASGWSSIVVKAVGKWKWWKPEAFKPWFIVIRRSQLYYLGPPTHGSNFTENVVDDDEFEKTIRFMGLRIWLECFKTLKWSSIFPFSGMKLKFWKIQGQIANYEKFKGLIAHYEKFRGPIVIFKSFLLRPKFFNFLTCKWFHSNRG